MNPGRPQTYRTPANQDAIIAVVGEDLGKAGKISRENWEYSNQGSSMFTLTIS